MNRPFFAFVVSAILFSAGTSIIGYSFAQEYTQHTPSCSPPPHVATIFGDAFGCEPTTTEHALIDTCTTVLKNHLNGMSEPSSSPHITAQCISLIKQDVWNSPISETTCSAFHQYERACAQAKRTESHCEKLSTHLLKSGAQTTDLERIHADAIRLCTTLY